MTINIIGCGPTAEQWDGTGDSLGVNDCEKTGKPVQNLLVIDWPGKFESQRLHTIMESKAIVWTQLSVWSTLRDVSLISTRKWKGFLIPGTVQHSSTSPFAAILLAWVWGYKEIILWGVDMKDQRPYLEDELFNMKELFKCLAKKDVSVWLGAEGSVLPLPVKQ